MDKAERTLFETLENMPVIDTHEHLETEDRQPSWNVLSDYTRHYFCCDLISAGLDPALITALADPARTIRQKWADVSRHWELCRHTGYGEMLDLAVQKLYGAPRIDGETIEAIEAGFQALRAEPGYAARMLRSAGIDCAINNIWRLGADDCGGLMRYVTQIDGWVMFDAEPVQEIGSLSQYIERCLAQLELDFVERGAFGLKCALAYRRSLDFGSAPPDDAERDYQRVRAGRCEPAEARRAQDAVMWAILRWANEGGRVLQLHTGYQEGNANLLGNANPEPLCAPIMANPRIRFDLFHIGYPYQHVAGALGKMFPNVCVDLCWAHVLSPVAARGALAEWLHLMPANKIFGFGGDCLFYDGAVGHLEMARRNVAKVLGDEVESGSMSLERAHALCRMLFYQNPREFYRI